MAMQEQGPQPMAQALQEGPHSKHPEGPARLLTRQPPFTEFPGRVLKDQKKVQHIANIDCEFL